MEWVWIGGVQRRGDAGQLAQLGDRKARPPQLLGSILRCLLAEIIANPNRDSRSATGRVDISAARHVGIDSEPLIVRGKSLALGKARGTAMLKSRNRS